MKMSLIKFNIEALWEKNYALKHYLNIIGWRFNERSRDFDADSVSKVKVAVVNNKEA